MLPAADSGVARAAAPSGEHSAPTIMIPLGTEPMVRSDDEDDTVAAAVAGLDATGDHSGEDSEDEDAIDNIPANEDPGPSGPSGPGYR